MANAKWRLSVFGAMRTAQRNAMTKTKPCKTRAKQTGLGLAAKSYKIMYIKGVKGLARANYGVPQIDQS